MQENKVVITDASCFILLDKIDAFSILKELYQVVITTPEIAAEYGRRLPEWVEVRAVQNRDLLYTYAESIDIGEASAMALANEIHADLIILDDGAARKFAEKLALEITGSIGVLLSAKRNNIIKEIRPYLDRIQITNFRITPSLINRILVAAGEV
jgi:predicted nucleic acid-binding protein